MDKGFKSFIKDNNLFTTQDRLLVTVSGGMDSVTLCHLLHKNGFKFGIAHANFQLRGKDSLKDEQFVAKLSKEYNVAMFCKKFDTTEFAKSHKLSIQEAARNLRYKWFEKVRKENKYDFVLTAHHLNDSIETFFINVLRGTGIAGLQGIKRINKNLRRPLLFATRKDIEVYLTQNKLSFRHDASNDKTEYTRNHIRLNVLTSLLTVDRNYEQKFADLFWKMEESTFIVQTKMEEIRQKCVSEADGKTSINIKELTKIERFEIFLFELLKPYGFNGSQSKKVAEALKNQVGAEFLTKEYALLIDRKCIFIKQKKSIHNIEKYTINEDLHEISIPEKISFKTQKMSMSFFAEKSKNTAHLDYSLLKFPLEIRPWKAGDSFVPLGMKGKKKVSDFLIDNKFSRFEKEKIKVLLSDGKICWIIGSRLDERFKLSDKSKKVFSVILKNE